MGLTKISEILRKAKDDKYAVGAFNADNLEMVQAFIAAAETMRSPLILQVSLGAINYSGLGSVTNIAIYEAKNASIPVAVHLDHVKTYDQNVHALLAGVGSLCIDAADLPFESNLAVTKRVCELAHTAGLDAEAGIGYVPDSRENLSKEEAAQFKTDIAQAQKLVEKTKVDLLAVSIGSMRGMKDRVIDLDLELLEQINGALNIPLVLHGASGVKWESIQDAIQHGICKVNIASTFDQCFVDAIRLEISQHPEEKNFRKILSPAREEIKNVTSDIFNKLGSSSKY